MARSVKEEMYADGWHFGRRLAEEDLRNGAPTNRGDQLRQLNPRLPETRAWHLGTCRGYRDTVARYEAGELTWEMFDQPPLGTQNT